MAIIPSPQDITNFLGSGIGRPGMATTQPMQPQGWRPPTQQTAMPPQSGMPIGQTPMGQMPMGQMGAAVPQQNMSTMTGMQPNPVNMNPQMMAQRPNPMQMQMPNNSSPMMNGIFGTPPSGPMIGR